MSTVDFSRWSTVAMWRYSHPSDHNKLVRKVFLEMARSLTNLWPTCLSLIEI